MNYKYWHQTAARTSQTRIILQPISSLHASLWNIPKQEMADWHHVMWHRECQHWAENAHRATTWPGSWGQRLSMALPRPRPSWGVLEDTQGQGQASRATRLLLFTTDFNWVVGCHFQCYLRWTLVIFEKLLKPYSFLIRILS